MAEAQSQPASGAQPARRSKRRGGVVVPHQPNWYQRLGAWVIYFLLEGICATLRYRWVDGGGLIGGRAPGPFIYGVWHNRLALSMRAYAHTRKFRSSPGLAAMVSASKDGGFLAAILERFGVQPVRGSSSRRGPQALLELTTWAERGYDLAITPDGPRGPRCVVQEGIMSLAQVTGLAIVPFSCRIHWKIRIRSWDGFQIPLPFSRCDMLLAPPVHVPADASDEQREALRGELEQTLRRLAPE